MLFGALGTLFYCSGRNFACGASIGFALGCKTFPAILFLPLLVKRRSFTPFVGFLLVALLSYTPFLLWDAKGLIANAFLWPQLMTPDSTTWLSYVPKYAVFSARLAVLGAVAWLWIRFLAGRELRLFWTLAMTSTLVLLAGNAFHNNYIPWASIWVVLAVVEAASWAGTARETDASQPV